MLRGGLLVSSVHQGEVARSPPGAYGCPCPQSIHWRDHWFERQVGEGEETQPSTLAGTVAPLHNKAGISLAQPFSAGTGAWLEAPKGWRSGQQAPTQQSW